MEDNTTKSARSVSPHQEPPLVASPPPPAAPPPAAPPPAAPPPPPLLEPPPAAPPPPNDPFDLSKLRLSQDFSTIGVKKLMLTVPVRKPNKQSYVRIRPGNEWYLETAVLELKDENETYLVTPELRDELALEIVPKVLFTAIDRQGVLFIWPVKLPQPDGRYDAWNRSALYAAEKAKTKWVRVISNRGLQAYEAYEAPATFPEPEWPTEDLQTIISIAFKDKLIDSLDHPVIRRLRGRS